MVNGQTTPTTRVLLREIYCHLCVLRRCVSRGPAAGERSLRILGLDLSLPFRHA